MKKKNNMNDFAGKNKIAWEFNSYEFWCQYNGKPIDYANKLISDPVHPLRRNNHNRNTDLK